MSESLSAALQRFDDNKELRHAEGLVQLVFEQLGVSQLINSTTIEFNNRFTNRAGDARLFKNAVHSPHSVLGNEVSGFNYKGRIRLGTKYFALASNIDKDETIIHEACHIVHRYLHHNGFLLSSAGIEKYDAHGQEWKNLMAKVGYSNASPYHCLNTTQFKNFYLLNCPRCGHKGRLTMQMGGRIINRTTFKACIKCRLLILPSYLKKVSGEELVK